MPTAPVAILPTAAGAGSPDEPIVVLAETGAGSPPSSPAAALGAAGGGGAPASPSVILAEIGDAGAPSSPVAAIAVATSGAELYIDFTDSEYPDRDGRYVYLGLFDSVNPVWARDDGSTAIISGLLTGSGMAFVQRDNGSGQYVWTLEDCSDWATTSPNVILSHLTAVDARSDEPTPADAGEWYDTIADAVTTSLAFSLVGLTAPLPILPSATTGAAPDSPETILASAAGASAPGSPQPILGVPLHGVYDTDGVPLTDTDGAILTN